MMTISNLSSSTDGMTEPQEAEFNTMWRTGDFSGEIVINTFIYDIRISVMQFTSSRTLYF